MQLAKQVQGWEGWEGWERRRAESAVETLATLRGDGESLAEVAHDARNMVTALELYCDLLQEPGVLATGYLHYGSELRLVSAASRRLVEKLMTLDPLRPPAAGYVRTERMEPGSGLQRAKPAERSRQAQRWDLMPAVPIDNLAAELLANRNLLAALAGPSIALTVHTDGGALAVRLTGEDLTRVLVNMVKNAAEAMPGGGKIRLHLVERCAQPGIAQPGPAQSGPAQSGPAQPGPALPGLAKPGTEKLLTLTVEDSGRGIPSDALDKIFESGFTTQPASPGGDAWPVAHRGLGLSITRSIIEGAGGRISAKNRDPAGARFEIELPAGKR
jgi:signal transduction histidine kinase